MKTLKTALLNATAVIPVEDQEWTPDAADPGETYIVLPPNGRGPVRPIITGLKKHPTGIYPSQKTGRTQYWEGSELLPTHEAETYPHIVDYQNQPFQLVFNHRGVQRCYTPDQIRQEVSGYIEVLEAKSDPRGFRDPEYRSLLDAVEERLADLKGWGFRRVVADEIFLTARHARNVGIVQSRRFVSVKPEHFALLADLRRGEQVMFAYGDLAKRFEPDNPLYGGAVVQALMVRRHLHIDLKAALSDQTVVWLLPEPAPYRNMMEI